MEDLKISDEEPVQPVYGGGPLPQALSSRQLGHTRYGHYLMNIYYKFKIKDLYSIGKPLLFDMFKFYKK